MKNLKLIILGSFGLILAACSPRSDKSGQDADLTVVSESQDILTGSMDVIVDESVLPLIREQVDVFHSDYTKSQINLVSRPERVAVNTLLNGHAAVAILTRMLTEEESAGFKSRSIDPRVFPVAYNAVVFVVKNTAGEDGISLADIKLFLTGKSSSGKRLVFDNVNSSSLRFLKEKTEVDKVVASQVVTTDSVADVFERVLSDDTFIGVMSLNQFLGNKDALDTSDNIRILGVKNEKDGQYYKPSQSSLGDDTYPFKEMVYVLNYQPNLGLGIGFSAFLTGDRGQRVVLRSGILPAKMPGRELIIRDEFKD